MMQNKQSAAYDRINRLLDEGSFVELGAYVTARSTDFNMPGQETPADGVLTGYGTIGSALVYVYSQDASVLAGSMGEMHAKKIVHIYEQACRMGAPVIGLIDCAGLRLQEATDALDGFGRLYKAQTEAAGVVPQIQAVLGSCGGGMAVSAALADFTFMESAGSRLFVNAPNAVKGNHEDVCNTASAAFQAEETGLADAVGTEDEILAQIRELVSLLPANSIDGPVYDICEDDLNRMTAGIEGFVSAPEDALKTISDNYYFFEVKKAYAPEMITGFIRLNGMTIGAVANKEPRLTWQGCDKAAEFVDFCDAFGIPILSLTNVEGYASDMETERHMARAAAGLTYTFASAEVPKVNLIIGKAYGTSYLSMNSQSIGADVVFAWPQASIGMMDPKAAAAIICAGTDADLDAAAAQYAELQSSALAAAKRGYVDDIIEPAETRKRLAAAFEMLFTKRRRS